MIPQAINEFEVLLQGCHHAKSSVVVTAVVRNLFELLNAVADDAEIVRIVRNCKPENKAGRN